MRREVTLWTAVAALLLGFVLLPTGLSAQDDYQDDYYDQYDDDDYDEQVRSLGLGAGIVRPDGDGEIYFGLNFRYRINKGDDRDRDDDRYEDADYNERHNRSHSRGSYRGGTDEGIRAYIEPEIGYWEQSDDNAGDREDLLVGVNLVGVVPTRAADFFLGVGVGLHFTDGRLVTADGDDVVVRELDESRLGANIQVGVELEMTESVGIFGAARLDILEDKPDDSQTKIWLGLRFHF